MHILNLLQTGLPLLFVFSALQALTHDSNELAVSGIEQKGLGIEEEDSGKFEFIEEHSESLEFI